MADANQGRPDGGAPGSRPLRPPARLALGPDPALSLVAEKEEHGNVKNLAGVLVHGAEATLSNALMHGKSPVERGVTWVKKPEDVPRPTRFWAVWVGAKHFPEGRGFAGVVATEMLIDTEAKLGYKNLAAQVNGMSQALAGKIDLAGMSVEERRALQALLREKGKDLYERATPEFKAALEG